MPPAGSGSCTEGKKGRAKPILSMRARRRGWRVRQKQGRRGEGVRQNKSKVDKTREGRQNRRGGGEMGGEQQEIAYDA